LFCGEKEKKYGGIVKAKRVPIGTAEQTNRWTGRRRQTDRETGRPTERECRNAGLDWNI